MSLLTKPRLITRWKKMLLVIVSILLLVPCVAAAAFNVRFDLETMAQEPVQERERQKVPREMDVDKMKVELKSQMAKVKEEADRLEVEKERGGNQAEIAKHREHLDREMLVLRSRAAELEFEQQRAAGDPAVMAEIQKRREFELQARDIKQAALVKLARINMDQAIQIATSQQPGKVMAANLDAKGWEELGKLGKEGVVFYHVEIADEVDNSSTHVFVNAVDGTIIKTEKELPRKQRRNEN